MKYLVSTLLLSLTSALFSQNITMENLNKKLIKPSYLKKGDTIVVIAPSGTLKGKQEVIEKGINCIESWGITVLKGNYLFEDSYHFAAKDAFRTEDLQKALDNPNIKAIWCARGGYGISRIIDKLDFRPFKKNPKWIIGYSDITVLHSHVHNLGFETLHAMMPIDFKRPKNEITPSIHSLKAALFGDSLEYSIPTSSYNQLGSATGQLVGGNLTLLQNVIGSTSEITTDGKIIFIEEIGEYKYQIDRMLIALKRAGFFKNCKGIIVGGMTNIKKNSPAFGKSIETIILEAIDHKNIPILFHFPAGHDSVNKALILGRKVHLTINATNATLAF